jgi:hypothetical protein
MTNGRIPEGSVAPPASPEHSSAASQVATGETTQSDRTPHPKETAVEAMIDRNIQNHLGMKLKESYEELVRQPVPDKFHQLLEELERKEKK